MLRLLTINIAAFSNVSANWTILSLVIGLNKSYFNFRRAVKRREYDQTINYDPYAATDGWHIDDIRDDALYIHIPHHVAGLGRECRLNNRAGCGETAEMCRRRSAAVLRHSANYNRSAAA